jgi:protein-disulfide isomerase
LLVVKFEALSAHREKLGWAGLVVRLALGGIWAWAALSKIGDPRTFLRAVRAYDATPEWLSKAIGFGLPMLELTLAVLLIVGLIVRYAAAVSAALFVVFIIGILQASARGIKLACGCFGGGGASTTTSYLLDVLRDLGLLALAVFLVLWPLTKFSVDGFIIATERVPGLSTKQAKSEKNLRRYRAAVAAAEVELRHKQRYIAAGTAIVVVLVSFIAIGVQSNRARISPSANSANATASTGVTVGNPKAPVTVDLYEDFQCPICNALEQSGLTADFDAKVKATNIKVNYHVMSFLDSSSNGNKYSSRAANAGYCASDQGTDAFQKFHDILYGKTNGKNNQPAEGSNGEPDSQLIAWGKQAGITSADFSTCVTSNQHKDLVAGVTDAASKKGVNGTPTVFVQGKEVKGSGQSSVTFSQVDAAITAALAAAKSTAAPSSSAPVTPSVPATVPATSTKSVSVKPTASPASSK